MQQLTSQLTRRCRYPSASTPGPPLHYRQVGNRVRTTCQDLPIHTSTPALDPQPLEGLPRAWRTSPPPSTARWPAGTGPRARTWPHTPMLLPGGRVSKSHGLTVVRPRKICLTLRKILRFVFANSKFMNFYLFYSFFLHVSHILNDF